MPVRKARVLYRRALRLSLNDPPQSWATVSHALQLDSNNVELNVLAGDLWLHEWSRMGFQDHSDSEAAAAALGYYETALGIRPNDPDAWAGKTHALLRLQRGEEAVVAAEEALHSLDGGEGSIFLRDPVVFEKTAEEVYDGAVRALLAVRRKDEARDVLEQALKRIEGSEYLRRLIPAVS